MVSQMKKSLDCKKLGTYVGLTVAAFVGLTTVAAAAQQPFSFIAVEFMPHDQKLAAAQAFVAANAAPGTPIRIAEAALSRAGVYCHGGRVVNGVVSCTLTSVAADSGNDSQHEVTWRVQITPDANGAVAAATVGRITDGF
jgi:hypothetical protein